MTPKERECWTLRAALEKKNTDIRPWRRMSDGKTAYVQIPRETAELILYWLENFELTDPSGL